MCIISVNNGTHSDLNAFTGHNQHALVLILSSCSSTLSKHSTCTCIILYITFTCINGLVILTFDISDNSNYAGFHEKCSLWWKTMFYYIRKHYNKEIKRKIQKFIKMTIWPWPLTSTISTQINVIRNCWFLGRFYQIWRKCFIACSLQFVNIPGTRMCQMVEIHM